MFRWIFGLLREPAEPESLRFLKALAASERPRISYDQCTHWTEVVLHYGQVDVELTWKPIRREWELNVRDRRTFHVLYGYYVTFGPPPRATVDFLLETYGLWPEISRLADEHEREVERTRPEVVAWREKKDRAEAERTAFLKGKYLGKDDGSG